MGKSKMYRYATVGKLANVVEFNQEFKGNWSRSYFNNNNPVVLELACGKGHYTLELARRNPEVNYVGVDIKGERIYVGATQALEEEIPNAAFLRIQIEQLDEYFSPAEVAGLWITFPDPYLRKPDKRLTSPRFLSIYRTILQDEGLVHLKTDDPTLYTYTIELLKKLEIEPNVHIPDIYSGSYDIPELYIQTYYEGLHLADGRTIRYLQFALDTYNPIKRHEL
jgi:tRNA (guanine-N7-)-methyltransferase